MTAPGAKSLPVAMYHYVNDLPSGISVSPRLFGEHCRALAEKGWRGIGLDEAEAFLVHGEPLPEKSLLITFDDGFLDNALYALPLLRQYGHKAVMFAVSNRLEPGAAPRAAFTGPAGEPDLTGARLPVQTTPHGFILRKDVFCNHAEIRAVDAEGVLAVASHSRGHYGVFAGPEYKNFFRPRSRLRTFYRTEAEPVWGLPDFPVRAGLAFRAFVPNPALVEAVKNLVPQDFDAAAAFFAREADVGALKTLTASFVGKLGRYETDAERGRRMQREIEGGKAELEGILGHAVRSLCWPWGKYCLEALDIARKAGFSLFFTTREGVNPPARPLAVHRFKGKDKCGAWLTSRAWVYSRPLLGGLYAKLRL